MEGVESRLLAVEAAVGDGVKAESESKVDSNAQMAAAMETIAALERRSECRPPHRHHVLQQRVCYRSIYAMRS